MEDDIIGGTEVTVSVESPGASSKSLESPADIGRWRKQFSKRGRADDGRLDFGCVKTNDIVVTLRGGGRDADETDTRGAETNAIGGDKANIRRGLESTIGMEMATIVSGRDLGTAVKVRTRTIEIMVLKRIQFVFDWVV